LSGAGEEPPHVLRTSPIEAKRPRMKIREGNVLFRRLLGPESPVTSFRLLHTEFLLEGSSTVVI